MAQIPNSSNRGKMGESWGRIEFSTTASLSFTSLGANFPRNLAAENSITPPFHLAELLLRQIFTGVNLIGGWQNLTTLKVWEAGHVEIHLSREKIYNSNTKHQLLQMSKWRGHFDDSELKSHRVDLRRYAVTEAWYLGGNCNWNYMCSTCKT